MKIDESAIEDVYITSGIRQGCNGSTVLFLLITYIIIEEISKMKLGIKINSINITTLFFADDGLLLSDNIQDAANIINKLEEVGNYCGLNINKSKSHHLINMNKDNISDISNIEVVNNIKYLGVKINEGRNCFKEHKQEKIMKSKQYSNLIMSVISKSSNKIMIGKTYWKNVILAEILYGSEVIFYTKKEIEELQRSENQAYRLMLGAPRYAPICSLRGEIGSSTMESRDKKNKITFAKHLLQSENKLIRDIAELDFNNNMTKFFKTACKYMEDLQISKDDLINKTNQQLKEVVMEADSEQWK